MSGELPKKLFNHSSHIGKNVGFNLPLHRIKRCGGIFMFRFVLALGAAIILSGCATITRGTTNQVQVLSEPPGATAQTTLGHQCVTPCSLSIPRKEEFVVRYHKDGYQDAQIPVKTGIAGTGAAGFAGNVLLGGVVGMGVDAATGATLEHQPNPVTVTLQPLGASGRAKPARPDRRRGKPAPVAAAPAPPEAEAPANDS